MVKCKARVSVESCNSEFIARSLSVDNIDYVKTHYEGGKVITDIEVNSIGSMLSTLDDLLVNVKIANDILCGRNADEDIRN
jgi:hypothetical protein